MKQKSIKLTDEETALISKFRANKEAEERSSTFELKFKKAIMENSHLIQQSLDFALEHIQDAINLSKEHGIPFQFSFDNDFVLANLSYYPESFYFKWGEHIKYNVLDEVLKDTGMIDHDICYVAGWEFWNSSSLNC